MHIVLALAFFLCWGVRASADSSLTIAAATAVVLSQHPLSAALKSEADAARALGRQARYKPNPEIEVGAGWKDAASDTGYEAEAALHIPVERLGRRDTRVGIARGEIERADANWARFRRDIELEVRKLGYALRVCGEDAEVAAEISARSRAMIELLKQRPVAGPAMLLELRVIEASLAEYEKSVLEFSAQRDVARRELNLLLGRAPDDALQIEDDLKLPAATFNLSELDAALDRNPRILASLAELRLAQFASRVARIEGKPDYRISPYFAREDAGEAETTVGVGFSMPLAWRNRNEGGIAAADARRQAAEAQVEAERLDARRELARLHRMYEAAVAQARALSSVEIERLRDAADLADRQYRLGAIPVQTFLDMQREFLSIQLLRHDALLNALVKEAELQWIAGNAGAEASP